MKSTPEIGDQENLTLMFEDLLVLLGELNSEAPKIKKQYKDIKAKLDEQDLVIQKGTSAIQAVADKEYDRVIKERDRLLERTAEMLDRMDAVSQKLNQSITEAAPIIQSIQSFEEYRLSLEARIAKIEAAQKTSNAPNLPSQASPKTATSTKIADLTTDEISRRTNGKISEEDVIRLICQMHEKGLGDDVIDNLLTRMVEEKMSKTEVSQEILKKVWKIETEHSRKGTSSYINYEEVNTIKNLYDKYHKYVDGPFLVVRNSWYGDYCLAVETFQRNNTWVRGRTFTNGIAGKQTSHHADTEEFRMYNGPSVDKIKAQL